MSVRFRPVPNKTHKLTFTMEEFRFLHRHLMRIKSKGRMVVGIRKKQGVNLNVDEKKFVKLEFERYVKCGISLMILI